MWNGLFYGYFFGTWNFWSHYNEVHQKRLNRKYSFHSVDPCENVCSHIKLAKLAENVLHVMLNNMFDNMTFDLLQ